MNPNKFLVVVSNLKDIEILKKVRVSNFLFPWKNFSVGFPETFRIDEMKEKNSFIYMNRLLDEKSIQKLKSEIKNIPENIKGIVFEDVGMIELLKEMNWQKETILYQSHFATNKESMNEMLKFVDSVVISTDITEEEIREISEETSKPFVYVLYGLIPNMYSRRTLLTNFEKEFSLAEKKEIVLEEPITKNKFIGIENEFGTVLYQKKYLNAQINLKDESIKYYFINPLFLHEENLAILIKNLIEKKPLKEELETTGFLHQKTIYRIKEEIK